MLTLFIWESWYTVGLDLLTLQLIISKCIPIFFSRGLHDNLYFTTQWQHIQDKINN